MSVYRSIETGVNAVLGQVGLVVLPRAMAPGWQSFFQLLKKKRLTPATIIDIGVAEGTPWLYQAFPKAFYYLVEPTREAQPYLERWARKLRAEIVNVALGADDGTAVIEVRDKLAGSTLYREVGSADCLARYDVPVRRFDQVIGHIQRPCLCKIDVQGAELAVIEGMARRIREIDFIIVEVSSIATLQEAPELAEVMRKLHDLGFVVYDLLGLLRRPLDQAMAQLDLAFVRADSPLRSDRRWKHDPEGR